MKRDFVRSKRTTADSIAPLTIKIDKRVTKSSIGIMQALINVVVYVLIFVLFFKDNIQFMGIFIAFMAASVVTQLIIRFGRSIKKSTSFPFFRIVKDSKLYKGYLRKIDDDIDAYIDSYGKYLSSVLFPPTKFGRIITDLSTELFWRLPLHQDFLTINLGQTYIQYPIDIVYPSFTYSENDEVLDRFKKETDIKISNKSKFLLPFAFSLCNNRSLAIVNKGIADDEFIQIVNAAIIDVTTFQSSEEVILCLAFDMDRDLDWTRFLPHVWYGNRRLIYSASEPETDFIKILNSALADKSKHVVAIVDVDFAKDCHFYDIFNNENLPENLLVIFFSLKGVVPTRTYHHLECSKIGNNITGSYNDYELLLNSSFLPTKIYINI